MTTRPNESADQTGLQVEGRGIFKVEEGDDGENPAEQEHREAARGGQEECINASQDSDVEEEVEMIE